MADKTRRATTKRFRKVVDDKVAATLAKLADTMARSSPAGDLTFLMAGWPVLRAADLDAIRKIVREELDRGPGHI
jgi:hypothetical protein